MFPCFQVALPVHSKRNNTPNASLHVRLHSVCMGFVWVHADSFLHSGASPFHSFVTIPATSCSGVKEYCSKIVVTTECKGKATVPTNKANKVFLFPHTEKEEASQQHLSTKTTINPA